MRAHKALVLLLTRIMHILRAADRHCVSVIGIVRMEFAEAEGRYMHN